MSDTPPQVFVGIVEDKVTYESQYFVSEMAGRFQHTCSGNSVDLYVEITGKVDATYDVATWRIGDMDGWC